MWAPPLADLAAAEQEVGAEPVGGEVSGDPGQRLGVDHGGLQLGEFSLAAVGILREDLGGDHQTEHGVAEELEPLVGRQTARLIGVAAMGQGEGQQIVGQVDAERLEQRGPVHRHSRPPAAGSGVSSSTGFMAASLAHLGSMTSW